MQLFDRRDCRHAYECIEEELISNVCEVLSFVCAIAETLVNRLSPARKVSDLFGRDLIICNKKI